MITNPGTLNRRVDIYAPVKKKEGAYDRTGKALFLSHVSASIQPMRGQETLEMGMTRADSPVKVTIRYRKNVAEDCEVHYQGHIYDVQSVADPQMEHESLELYCVERRRGATLRDLVGGGTSE